MTITYGNPAVQAPSGCGHWVLNFSVTTEAGTVNFSHHIHRDDITSADPGESMRELAVAVAILQARRMAKAAGAANVVPVNAALRNQVVVL